MRIGFLKGSFASFLVGLVVSASAQVEEIQADRPDQTESPYTVPARHLQIESGISYEKEGEGYVVSHPSTLIKWGMAKSFELGLVAEIITVKENEGSSRGLTPLTIRFRKNLVKEKGIIPITSFIGYLTFPTLSSKKFRSTFYAPAFRFTMEHTLSTKVSLGYNLGAEWDGEKTIPTYIYTLTTGIDLTSKMGSFVEVYGYLNKDLPADHRFDCGLTYLIKKNVLFDMSGGISLTERNSYYVGTGFSFRLKN